jgi:hypothetical protein
MKTSSQHPSLRGFEPEQMWYFAGESCTSSKISSYRVSRQANFVISHCLMHDVLLTAVCRRDSKDLTVARIGNEIDRTIRRLANIPDALSQIPKVAFFSRNLTAL